MFKVHESHEQHSGHNWIGQIFFTDLIQGLRLTLRYLFSRAVTLQYPDKETWVPYPRHRGHPYLRKDDKGEIKCVGCELCAKICPCNCITVIPYEDEKGMYCGLCEDACPEEAIALGPFFEFSSYNSEYMVLNKEQLLALPERSTKGGYVAKAELKETGRVEVKPGSKAKPDWWSNIRKH
jgi:NADH-quinone oxidoreductase subunit I